MKWMSIRDKPKYNERVLINIKFSDDILTDLEIIKEGYLSKRNEWCNCRGDIISDAEESGRVTGWMIRPSSPKEI